MSRKESITLHGGKARRFRALKEQLEDKRGYNPTKPEVIGHLLAHYDGPHLDDDRR